MARPALFLDRDGTIIADAHYPSNPDDVVLLPGAAAAIARANAAHIPVIVVTNQSGIGRGQITVAQYESVRERLDELLRAEHATVDATYHCPHWIERDGPCDCRKPGIGMHKQAAADHTLSLAASAYIGDRCGAMYSQPSPRVALGCSCPEPRHRWMTFTSRANITGRCSKPPTLLARQLTWPSRGWRRCGDECTDCGAGLGRWIKPASAD